MFNLKNLQIKVYPYSRFVSAKNSLIKFRNFDLGNKHKISPELYANSSYTDIQFVTDYLSTIFATPKEEMRIFNFEFSLTVNALTA